MKKSTVGSIAAFAVIATGVIWGSVAWRDAREAAPEPTAVVQVEPRGFVSEPTVTPTPTPEPVVGPAPIADEPAEPIEEPISDGCPDGYISDEHGCHSPICEVLEDGTEIPCQG